MNEPWKVVYEHQEDFVMTSGPFGYHKVGIEVNDRVIWFGMRHYPHPFGKEQDEAFEASEAICKEIVESHNAMISEVQA